MFRAGFWSGRGPILQERLNHQLALIVKRLIVFAGAEQIEHFFARNFQTKVETHQLPSLLLLRKQSFDKRLAAVVHRLIGEAIGVAILSARDVGEF